MVNKKGELLSTCKEITNEYKEYFDQLLNSESNVSQGGEDVETDPPHHSMENEENEPNREEIY